MHGIDGYVHQYQQIADWIVKYHPNTMVFNLDIFEGRASIFHTMEAQLQGLIDAVAKLKVQYKFDEFHLLCHSQGALMCRAYVQSQTNHTVRNFISLTSPQMGIFGLTGVVDKYLPAPLLNVTREEVYRILYTAPMQHNFVVANYCTCVCLEVECLQYVFI